MRTLEKAGREEGGTRRGGRRRSWPSTVLVLRHPAWLVPPRSLMGGDKDEVRARHEGARIAERGRGKRETERHRGRETLRNLPSITTTSRCSFSRLRGDVLSFSPSLRRGRRRQSIVTRQSIHGDGKNPKERPGTERETESFFHTFFFPPSSFFAAYWFLEETPLVLSSFCSPPSRTGGTRRFFSFPLLSFCFSGFFSKSRWEEEGQRDRAAVRLWLSLARGSE